MNKIVKKKKLINNKILKLKTQKGTLFFYILLHFQARVFIIRIFIIIFGLTCLILVAALTTLIIVFKAFLYF